MISLKGKCAIVTGGGQGIGRTVALKLASLGAAVSVCDINADSACAAAGDIQQMGVAGIGLACDVTLAQSVDQMVQETYKSFGQIDILVNNAGITRDGLLLRMKEADWDMVLTVNLKSAFLCSKAALRYIMKSPAGRVINIASVVGVMGNAGQANYSASKAGVIGLTKTMAREFAGRKVTVNAVAPGFIMTAMTERLPEAVKETYIKNIPMGALGTPEDVANAVAFLAGDTASYITGQVLHVDGGMVM